MKLLLLSAACLTAVVCSTVDGIPECREVMIITDGEEKSPGLVEKTYFARTSDGNEIAVKIYQQECFDSIVPLRHYILIGKMHRSTLHIVDCKNIIRKRSTEDGC